jgi:hypothetical protein
MENAERPGVDRRSFIKRAAATGGITVFAAPAIQTVVAGAARAQNVGATPRPGCFHSVEPDRETDGGCMGACTSVGPGLGGQCADICGEGCPVGSGNDNPCASDDYCDPGCYEFDEGASGGAHDNTVTFVC